MSVRVPRQWNEQLARRLRLRDLRYLLAVAERGSMAKAASALSVSQPAISQAISNLEHALGVRLFDRGGRGAEPTLYGQSLIRRAQAVVDELKQGVGEIEFLADPTVGQVRIGCPEYIAAGIMPAIVTRFMSKFPGVELIIEQTSVTPLDFHELIERKFDLMIGRMVNPYTADALHVEALYQEPVVIIAGASSRWAKRRKVALSELLNERWVRAPLNSPVGQMHLEAFAAEGLELKEPMVATFSQHLILYLVATEGFVGTLSGTMAHLCPARGIKVLPIDFAMERRPIAIVTLKNRAPSAVTQRFIECVRAETASKQVEMNRLSEGRGPKPRATPNRGSRLAASQV